MTLAEKRSRKAKGSSCISFRVLREKQENGCPVDIDACRKLLLFLCRCNRNRVDSLERFGVIAETSRNTLFIQGRGQQH
jgi:hypothetical protein